MGTEVRVASYDELLAELFANSWNAHIGRYRSPYVFRGMDRASCGLSTSLQRLGGPYARLERHLLRNFRKYAHREATPGASFWHILTVAQHHGLPTRLLDWTYSPYVALHFATGDLRRFDEDAVIWMIDYHATSSRLPHPPAHRLMTEGSNVFTVEMLDALVADLSELDRLARDAFVVFLEPPSIDERISNQFALFSVMSNPSIDLGVWLADRPDLYRRIVIPAALKWEIRDKLDQANITERVLFPGLDGLSAWLRRHYSPAPTAVAPPADTPASGAGSSQQVLHIHDPGDERCIG